MSHSIKGLKALLLMVSLLALTALACGGSGTITPTLTSPASSPRPVTSEPDQPTEVPQPTDTPQPAATPRPTNTSEPTATPRPTNTSEPSATPEPTLAPEPTNTPEPSQTPLPFDEAVSFADWEYSVTDAAVSTTIGGDVARGTYIVALVRATNNGATEREIGSRFFVAHDAQGRTYDMDTDASLEYHQTFGTDAWYLEDIGPSATGTIPVAFDVSPDASGVVLLAAGTNKPVLFLVEDVGGEPLTLPGEPTNVADWSFVVTDEVGLATSIGDEVPRGQYVMIIVIVRNDSPTTRELGSAFFVIEDGEGRTYDMDTDASLEYHQTFGTDAWYLEDIGPSLIGTIPLVFDVSPDATRLALHAQQGAAEAAPVLGAVGGEPIQLSGQVHSSGNWEFAIEEISTSTSIGDEVAQGEFLMIILQVKNLAPSEQELGSRIFALKDAQGRTYEMDTDASLEYHQTFRTNAWHLEDIGPSLTGTIPVLFDVATDASGFVLLVQGGTEIPLP